MIEELYIKFRKFDEDAFSEEEKLNKSLVLIMEYEETKEKVIREADFNRGQLEMTVEGRLFEGIDEIEDNLNEKILFYTNGVLKDSDIEGSMEIM